jgi:hypothetical protein
MFPHFKKKLFPTVWETSKAEDEKLMMPVFHQALQIAAQRYDSDHSAFSDPTASSTTARDDKTKVARHLLNICKATDCAKLSDITKYAENYYCSFYGCSIEH